MEKNELRTLCDTHTKVNSKWIQDLNVTIKLLEENISRKLSDINHSNILYDPPHKEIKK